MSIDCMQTVGDDAGGGGDVANQTAR